MIINRIVRKFVKTSRSSPLEEWIPVDELRRLQSLPRYTATETTLLGKKIKIVDPCTYIVGISEIFLAKSYFYRDDASNRAIIDCGANIGLSTIFLKLQNPNARIVAYEADPDIFAVLRENVASFEFSDVVVECKAIGATNCPMWFCQYGGFAGRVGSTQGDHKGVLVLSQRLKEILVTEETIEFLKIDIEGAEVDTLEDCGDELTRVKRIFVEYHSQVGQKQRLHKILEILARLGFRVQLKTSFSSPYPFVEFNEMAGMDFQTDIFAVRH